MKLLAPLTTALIASCTMAPPPAPQPPTPDPTPVVDPDAPVVPEPPPPGSVSPEAAAQAVSLNDEGHQLWKRDNDLAGAADRFGAAARLDPRGAYLFDYCDVLHQLERWPEALEVCREVLRRTDDRALLAKVDLLVRDLEQRLGATAPTTIDPYAPVVADGAPIRAFACADPPRFAIFSQLESCASNAGAPVLAKKRGPGDYTIHFVDLAARVGGAAGNVQVSSITPLPSTCQLDDWKPFGRDLRVRVYCHDLRGDPIDARFSVLVTFPARPDGRHVTQAYARFQPGARPEDVVSATHTFAPTGATPTLAVPPASRLGYYRVTLPGMGRPGGNVIITPIGRSAARCSVGERTPDHDDLSVAVLCTGATGAAGDHAFSLLATLPAPAGPDPSIGYVWLGDAKAETPLTADVVVNGSGGVTTVRRSAPGEYRVVLRGMARPVINVQAVAFEGRAVECHPADWETAANDLIVNVHCFRAGTGVDSEFSLLVSAP